MNNRRHARPSTKSTKRRVISRQLPSGDADVRRAAEFWVHVERRRHLLQEIFNGQR